MPREDTLLPFPTRPPPHSYSHSSSPSRYSPFQEMDSTGDSTRMIAIVEISEGVGVEMGFPSLQCCNFIVINLHQTSNGGGWGDHWFWKLPRGGLIAANDSNVNWKSGEPNDFGGGSEEDGGEDVCSPPSP